MRQPLLQGAGVQFNRIAGPGAQPGDLQRRDAGADQHRHRPGRLRGRRAESGQRRGSRLLGAVLPVPEPRRGDSRPRQRPGRPGGRSTPCTASAARAARPRKRPRPASKYYLFRSTAEQSLNALYAAEAKLRYLLGLAATDGRLIRPKDEPTTAKVTFDWCDVLNEGLARSVELRQQKWIVKRRELELIAAKNFLLPKLDFVAQYRWLGLGNDLFPVANGTWQPTSRSPARTPIAVVDQRRVPGMADGIPGEHATWASAARWPACATPN